MPKGIRRYSSSSFIYDQADSVRRLDFFFPPLLLKDSGKDLPMRKRRIAGVFSLRDADRAHGFYDPKGLLRSIPPA